MTEMQFQLLPGIYHQISLTCILTDVVSMETSSTSLGEDYQKIECAVLYWHKSSGYIYDPVCKRRRERERERGGEGRLEKEDIDNNRFLLIHATTLYR